MSNITIPKDYKAIIDPFLRTGQISLERSTRHVCAVAPTGRKHFIPGSPGDHRALANFKSQFKTFVRNNVEA